MEIVLYCFSWLLIILSLLPFIQNQHWVFRVAEFLKLQLFFIQLLCFALMFAFVSEGLHFWIVQSIQFVLIIYHAYIMMRYTKFWRTNQYSKSSQSSEVVKIVSCNIYQFNKDFDRFIQLINNEKPDIFLTMESNADWEIAMRVLENDYPNYEKVTLENTYGMHFYTNLKVTKSEVHYFVADDLPSIEVELETRDGYKFIFFAVHPPPPSPTEEKNSKERDGDLLSVAKKVRDYKLPIVITGDFNNVAWAKSSLLFKKTSRLIDARIGRGVLSTFHAKYWFFRVPLDLVFHSQSIFIDKLFIYPCIGSDHFPIGCSFYIDKISDEQTDEVKDLEKGEMQEVKELIEEGKNEESENREEVATE